MRAATPGSRWFSKYRSPSIPVECVGIVGESGSGKTQVFMAAMGLLSDSAEVSGSVRFAGSELLRAGVSSLNRVRGSKLTMIFQDPMTSLTPHLPDRHAARRSPGVPCGDVMA